MDNFEKEALAAYLIDLAKKNGADEIAIDLNEECDFGVLYRDGGIEQLEESRQCSLSVDLYCQHRFSSHSTNNLNKAALTDFIKKSVHTTKYLAADKFRELPNAKYYSSLPETDLKLYDPIFDQIKTEDRIHFVKEIYEKSRNISDKIISFATSYADTAFSNLKMHSNGFSGHTRGTLFTANAEVTVKDSDARPEDWYSVQNRYNKGILSAEIIGQKAVWGALKKIGQVKIASGKYSMLVENRAARRLISMLMSPMSAASIQQKSSYMDGMLNKAVTSKVLTIIDNPHIPGGLGSRNFDEDGIAARERTIIQNGILHQYYVDNYYGNKLGMKPNGGSCSNLLFNNGSQSIEELAIRIKRGIFITGFNGGDYNSTTGDFSFGISGFLIVDGEFAKPINEMNVYGNAISFWHKLTQLGNDPYPYSKWQVPSLLFEDIDFSGS